MFIRGSWNDRRRFQRLTMNLCVNYRVVKPLELRFKLGDRELDAEMIDISSGGMAVMTSDHIPPSTVLHLKFSLFKIDKNTGSAVFYRPFEIKGQVRSSIRVEKGHRLGICFQRDNTEVSLEMKEIAREATFN